MKLFKLPVALLLSLTLFYHPAAQAEEQQSNTTGTGFVQEDKGPEDALNKGNPRSSIIGFLDAASEFNWEKAAEYLDMRNLPANVARIGGPELAGEFNHVLSRAVWLDQLTVSDSPDGLQGDGLPGFRDELL